MVTAGATFGDTERLRASAWKRISKTLPGEAKAPAPYIGKDGAPLGHPVDFCVARRIFGLLTAAGGPRPGVNRYQLLASAGRWGWSRRVIAGGVPALSGPLVEERLALVPGGVPGVLVPELS